MKNEAYRRNGEWHSEEIAYRNDSLQRLRGEARGRGGGHGGMLRNCLRLMLLIIFLLIVRSDHVLPMQIGSLSQWLQPEYKKEKVLSESPLLLRGGRMITTVATTATVVEGSILDNSLIDSRSDGIGRQMTIQEEPNHEPKPGEQVFINNAASATSLDTYTTSSSSTSPAVDFMAGGTVTLLFLVFLVILGFFNHGRSMKQPQHCRDDDDDSSCLDNTANLDNDDEERYLMPIGDLESVEESFITKDIQFPNDVNRNHLGENSTQSQQQEQHLDDSSTSSVMSSLYDTVSQRLDNTFFTVTKMRKNKGEANGGMKKGAHGRITVGLQHSSRNTTVNSEPAHNTNILLGKKHHARTSRYPTAKNKAARCSPKSSSSSPQRIDNSSKSHKEESPRKPSVRQAWTDNNKPPPSSSSVRNSKIATSNHNTTSDYCNGRSEMVASKREYFTTRRPPQSLQGKSKMATSKSSNNYHHHDSNDQRSKVQKKDDITVRRSNRGRTRSRSPLPPRGRSASLNHNTNKNKNNNYYHRDDQRSEIPKRDDIMIQRFNRGRTRRRPLSPKQRSASPRGSISRHQDSRTQNKQTIATIEPEIRRHRSDASSNHSMTSSVLSMTSSILSVTSGGYNERDGKSIPRRRNSFSGSSSSSSTMSPVVMTKEEEESFVSMSSLSSKISNAAAQGATVKMSIPSMTTGERKGAMYRLTSKRSNGSSSRSKFIETEVETDSSEDDGREKANGKYTGDNTIAFNDRPATNLRRRGRLLSPKEEDYLLGELDVNDEKDKQQQIHCIPDTICKTNPNHFSCVKDFSCGLLPAGKPTNSQNQAQDFLEDLEENTLEEGRSSSSSSSHNDHSFFVDCSTSTKSSLTCLQEDDNTSCSSMKDIFGATRNGKSFQKDIALQLLTSISDNEENNKEDGDDEQESRSTIRETMGDFSNPIQTSSPRSRISMNSSNQDKETKKISNNSGISTITWSDGGSGLTASTTKTPKVMNVSGLTTENDDSNVVLWMSKGNVEGSSSSSASSSSDATATETTTPKKNSMVGDIVNYLLGPDISCVEVRLEEEAEEEEEDSLLSGSIPIEIRVGSCDVPPR